MAINKLKEIKADEIKVKTSTIDNDANHDSVNANKLRKEKAVRKDPKHYRSHHRSIGHQSNKVVVAKGDDIQYITRKEAAELIALGYSFASKKLWKTKVRDV